MTALSPISEQTYLARLTPPGSGAIAALALCGPNAQQMLAEFFQPLGKAGRKNPFREELALQTSGRFWLGRLGDPTQGFGDEVVIALKSITPRLWFEIHCHGGPQVIALLEELFASKGVQVCPWIELFRNTGTDPITLAAHHALGEAATTRTASILLDQYQGAFAQAVQTIRRDLEQNQPEQALEGLRALVGWVPLGRHLTHPWRVVVAGAPNVGKSSLINRLAGYQRCVVSPTPGTTRDLVSTRIAVDGWPVELIDTAGVREQAAALETEGIELALAAAAEADLCLWLLDASAPPVFPPRPVPSLRLVLNKIDLPAAWAVTELPETLRLSAETGAGLDELLQSLSRWLIPEVPAAGAAVPFNATLGQIIETAWNACLEGQWEKAGQVLQRIEQQSAQGLE